LLIDFLKQNLVLLRETGTTPPVEKTRSAYINSSDKQIYSVTSEKQ